MKLSRGNISGIDFFYRDGYSDKKTFDEVIGKRTYLQRKMTIQPGENWMDCGANVGAFALLAISKGASVTCYEPDPFNCKMIERNLKLNGFNAEIINAALVSDQTKECNLFIGNDKQVWRNSIVKNWNGTGIKVRCINFYEEAERFKCCKMDIEGAEMRIIEGMDSGKCFDKFVFEWTFQLDRSLQRFWDVIDKLKSAYHNVDFSEKTTHYNDRSQSFWQENWFPKCTNVFCYGKN